MIWRCVDEGLIRCGGLLLSIDLKAAILTLGFRTMAGLEDRSSSLKGMLNSSRCPIFVLHAIWVWGFTRIRALNRLVPKLLQSVTLGLGGAF